MMRSHLTPFMAVLVAGPLFAAAAAAQSPGPDTIIVAAPHSRVVGRNTTTGAPITETAAQVIVSYADLDLRSASGRDVLNARVSAAAHKACQELNGNGLVDPTTTPAPEDCYADTMKRASADVDVVMRGLR